MIKVLWGSDWDELFARDTTGVLLKRMEECVDGEYQNFKARGGAYVRREFFGKYPELLKLVEDKTDDQLANFVVNVIKSVASKIDREPAQ